MAKARGVCNIRGEMLKAGGEVTVQWLAAIFIVVWRTGVTPKEWRRAIIIPVYKKGSKRVCKNYRGISLLMRPHLFYHLIFFSAAWLEVGGCLTGAAMSDIRKVC